MELIVIAAGRGSRFTKAGIYTPKPLVLFNEKPLFWWAAESALSSGDFSSIHFAILREHMDTYRIDKEIQFFYPKARIHIIEQVTSGAAETAAIIASKVSPLVPVAFVDCDIAFAFSKSHAFSPLLTEGYSASLCLFKSNNPAFSYALFNSKNEIISTIEKEVKSDWAICGLYAFRSAGIYLNHFLEYRNTCNYDELFISGIINNIADCGEKILPIFLSDHLSLGTPEDIQNALAKYLHIPKLISRSS